MSAPVPFIQLDSKTGQLRVTDEARASLSKLRGTVAVCAVAGVYRTGKSYILNQLAGQQSGFGVGSSVQACTKGIWMWGAPLKLEGNAPGAPKHLLLLDTEGLASISQTEGHDAKIFCLALLLSSFFVYNSEKAINSAAIDQLSLVVQLIQKIRVHAEGAAAESQGAAADPNPKTRTLTLSRNPDPYPHRNPNQVRRSSRPSSPSSSGCCATSSSSSRTRPGASSHPRSTSRSACARSRARRPRWLSRTRRVCHTGLEPRTSRATTVHTPQRSRQIRYSHV